MATKLYINLMDAIELQKFMEKSLPGVVQRTVHEVLEEFGDRAVVDTKKEFGVYQPPRPGQDENFEAWPSLTQYTIDHKKVRTGQDTPLLDRGDLQASVEKMDIDEYVMAVGTYDPNGARSEYGTATAPARPWLRPVLFALKAPFSLALRQRLIEAVRSRFKPFKKV